MYVYLYTQYTSDVCIMYVTSRNPYYIQLVSVTACSSEHELPASAIDVAVDSTPNVFGGTKSWQ